MVMIGFEFVASKENEKCVLNTLTIVTSMTGFKFHVLFKIFVSNVIYNIATMICRDDTYIALKNNKE